jgi:putative N6-adenine-specific DNA methylase
VDSSGERLHRRGWRQEGGDAPLRETLAAAVLALARWQPDEPLYDPMCGSGTIPLEACARSLGLAPGLARSFAFESWPGLDAAALARWTELRAEAAAAAPGGAAGAAPRAPVVAGDRAAASALVPAASVLVPPEPLA